MATGQGIVIFDFGAAPGTNIVQTVVSTAAIGAASKVEIYMMGTDSTIDHNTDEHAILPMEMSLSCVSISAATGFTAQAATQLRLTGLVAARYVWAD